MSKTKETILQTALDHCQTYPSPVQRTFIYKAMDEYAQQAVNEYKEKLTAKIQNEIDSYHADRLVDYTKGICAGLDTVKEMIKVL